MNYISKEDLDLNSTAFKLKDVDENIIIGKTFKRSFKVWLIANANYSSWFNINKEVE